MPVCVARVGREGRACMLVVLAGHDGSHGRAAPGHARTCRCYSGVATLLCCRLVCLRGSGLCSQGWV